MSKIEAGTVEITMWMRKYNNHWKENLGQENYIKQPYKQTTLSWVLLCLLILCCYVYPLLSHYISGIS